MDNIQIETTSVSPSDVVVATYKFKELDAFQQQNNYRVIASAFPNNKTILIPDMIGIEVMNENKLKALIEMLQNCYNEKYTNKS